MSTGKQEGTRRELLSVRQRQRQLGRGLRIMYEKVLREPMPAEMLEVLRATINSRGRRIRRPNNLLDDSSRTAPKRGAHAARIAAAPGKFGSSPGSPGMSSYWSKRIMYRAWLCVRDASASA
jgi:hypothetical protein